MFNIYHLAHSSEETQTHLFQEETKLLLYISGHINAILFFEYDGFF